MTTHWSLVAAAKPEEVSPAQVRAALEELCRSYWYPLYAFVRTRGYTTSDAQDLTQAFFVRILETDGLALADRKKGRFRSYLLGAMKHFLANEWHRKQTQKRGGDVIFIDWDALNPETRFPQQTEKDPDHVFDREWALATVSTALTNLRQEMINAGKEKRFEVLKGCLTGESILSHQDMATRLGMSEGATKVAVHRLRHRYRTLLRATLSQTVYSEADLGDEMRYLVTVLREQ